MMLKKLFFIVMLAANVLLLHAQSMDTPVAQVARNMMPGWNLGNTLEAGNNANNFTNNGGLGAETSWQGTRTTQEVIDYVRSLGFKSVRIPCAWVMGHITNAMQMTIDPQWMARVKEVVDLCINDGLYVVLNDHWDGGWVERSFEDTSNSTVTLNCERMKKLWTQIATEFRDYDEHLIFAGLNEPNVENATQMAVLLRYEQAFIDAVRTTGGNNARRILVVQGPTTDIDRTVELMNTMPTDAVEGRLMVEVHYYSPWNFALRSDPDGTEVWNRNAYYWGAENHVEGSIHNSTWGEEDYMLAQLQKMKTKFVDNGIPVVMGEYGALWRYASGAGEDQSKHDASVKLFYKLFNQWCIEMGMVPMAWCINYAGRPTMTLVNRSSRTIYCTPAMEGIQEALAATSIEQPQVAGGESAARQGTYTLGGVRVAGDALQRGIYIRNGKKIAVR